MKNTFLFFLLFAVLVRTLRLLGDPKREFIFKIYALEVLSCFL